MQVNSAYKFRIYPNEEQKVLLSKHFGCVRFTWNYFLNQRKEYYLKNKEEIEAKRIKGNLNYYDNAKELTLLKKKEEYKWLNECNSQSLQACLKHLDSAYKMFFRKTHKFPQFKSKDKKQSFTIPQHFKIENNKIYFPKFKEGIKVKSHRRLEGKFVVATLSKNPNGSYYIAIITEKEIEAKKELTTQVGIDLGIKDFAILSNGKVYQNQKSLRKQESKLKFLQQRLSKKVKGSTNRSKARKRVSALHQKIRNSRIDYIHKISNEITNENQVICLENLAVANMMKNHKLAKSIADVSWHEFKRQLEYKCKWKGRDLIIIDRFFPSSKTCNSCGFVNSNLTLKDRTWKCPSCNTDLDRDLNASKNILMQGILKLNSTKEEQNKAVGTIV
jgi:putative transposase